VIRVCVAGVTGWTGSAVAEAVEAVPDLELVSGVSRSDPRGLDQLLE
jgi:4-hydroxy-tetrahydrodipicolinate reductase